MCPSRIFERINVVNLDNNLASDDNVEEHVCIFLELLACGDVVEYYRACNLGILRPETEDVEGRYRAGLVSASFPC